MASLQLFRRYDDGDVTDGEDSTTTTEGGQLQLIRVSETPSASDEYTYDELQDEAMASDDIIIEPSSYRKRSSKSGGGLFKTVVEGTGAGYAGVKQYLDGDLSPYKTSPRQSADKDSFSSGGNDGSASVEIPGFAETSVPSESTNQEPASATANNEEKAAETVEACEPLESTNQEPASATATNEEKPAETAEASEPLGSTNQEPANASAINEEKPAETADKLLQLEDTTDSAAEPETGIENTMENSSDVEANLGSDSAETEDTQPKMNIDAVETETQAPAEPESNGDAVNVELTENADSEKSLLTEPETVTSNNKEAALSNTEDLSSTESMKKEASDKPVSNIETLKDGLPEMETSDESASVEMPDVEQNGIPEKDTLDAPERTNSASAVLTIELPGKECSGDVSISDSGRTELPKTESSAQLPSVYDLLKDESSNQTPSCDAGKTDLPEKETSVSTSSGENNTIQAQAKTRKDEPILTVPDVDLPAAVEASWSGSSPRLPTLTMSETSAEMLKPSNKSMVSSEKAEAIQMPSYDAAKTDLPEKEKIPSGESNIIKTQTETRNDELILPVPEVDLPAAVEASWSGSSSRLPTLTMSEASAQKAEVEKGNAALVAISKVTTCTKDETTTVTAIASGSTELVEQQVKDEGRHSHSQQQPQPHRMGPLERFRNKVREKLSQVRINKGRKESPVDEFGDLFNVYGSSSPR